MQKPHNLGGVILGMQRCFYLKTHKGDSPSYQIKGNVISSIMLNFCYKIQQDNLRQNETFS